MCGFVGSINFNLDENIARSSLVHRGPDEQAGYTESPVSLYHVRLAIQDVADGSQPMQYGDLVTIYNGEIYNHHELRKAHKLECRTDSDTETLLHLYNRMGKDCLHELDGMFAMAIYDRSRRKLFLARDRAGKKPLYFYRDADKLVYASELNCLRALLPLQVDQRRISEYLKSGLFYQSETPYQQVEEIPAGHCLEIDVESLQGQGSSWWSIEPFYQRTSNSQRLPDLQQEIDNIDEMLGTSIQRRLVSSDLEVGAFLSGGIDSGLVVAKASRLVSKPLKTFTMSFDGVFDESELARSVAQQYGTEHHQIDIQFNELEQDIEKILAAYGEPFADSSAIPSYYVCREAKKHLTVVLNGDGADELFGGYRRYVPYSRFNLFALPTGISSAAAALLKALPSPRSKTTNYNYAYRLLALMGQRGVERYLSSTYDVFTGHDCLRQPSGAGLEHPDNLLQSAYEKTLSGSCSSLQKMMLMDFTAQLGATFLPKMDIASMQHSLEARSPFLAKELLEYVPGMEDKYKISGKTTKYLLRELSKRYLPQDVTAAPKRGFEVPLQRWVDGQLRSVITDYLGSSNAIVRDYVAPEFYQTLMSGDAAVAPEKRAKMIWMLFATEVWLQRNGKTAPVATSSAA